MLKSSSGSVSILGLHLLISSLSRSIKILYRIFLVLFSRSILF
jgi:hypothetical protein